MARPRNSAASVQVTISVSKNVLAYLDELVDNGTLGKTRAEVIFELTARSILDEVEKVRRVPRKVRDGGTSDK